MPITLLSLAAVAAVVALSGVARRVLGALLIVVGITAASSGHWLAVLGGVLVAASGVLQVAFGHRMRKIGVGGQQRSAHDPETDMWRALERGDDPTDDKAPGRPDPVE